MTPLTYPPDAARQIFELLIRRKERWRSELAGTAAELEGLLKFHDEVEPIPRAEVVRELVDAIFFAGLTQEEGKPVTASLLYVDPEVSIRSRWPVVRFRTPILMSVEALQKLSPATSAPDVDVGVYQSSEGAYVWGLVYARTQGIPAGIVFRTVRAGSFIVSISDQLLLSYSNGTLSIPDNDETIEARDLPIVLSRIFDDTRSFPDRLKSAAQIVEFGFAALRAGVGATVLVVPDPKTLADLDTPKYAIHDDSRSWLAEAIAAGDARRLTRAIASLASIDGALVVDERLNLIGAGVMIRTPKCEDFTVCVVNPHAPAHARITVALSQFSGGARHRSALVYCYRNPGAVALIVSHDGVLSLATRPLKEDLVLVIRPIRLDALPTQVG